MTTLAATASTNWTNPIPHTWSYGIPCLAYDEMWMCFNNTVYGYDQVTGQLKHELGGFNGSPRAAQPFDGGLMVVSTDGNVYKADITGKTPPRAIGRYNADPGWVTTHQGSVYLFTQRNGLWRVAPINGGEVTGEILPNTVRDFPTITPDGILVPRVPHFIDVIDPQTMRGRATIDISGATVSAAVAGASNGRQTALVLDEKTVVGLDTAQQKVAWRVEANAKLTPAAAADPNYFYAGTADGRIFVFDILTGSAVRQLHLATGRIQQIFVDDGLVYSVCGEHGDTDMFIFAADPHTGTVVKHAVKNYASIVGVDNGVVYYTDAATVGAVRLADIVREFYAESVLLQDLTYPGGKEVKTPSVDTEITLYDKSGGYFASQTVMVGATSPITIESGGRSFTVGSGASVALKTDGNGKLRIAMPAGDVDSKGALRPGLTTPSLVLLTSFMDPADRILVRPDTQMHDELGKLTQTRLQNARGYDGKFVVVDKYRTNDKVMANVAAMVAATTGMVKGSVENRKALLAASGKRYLAPGCDMATICCCKAGDYDCKLVCKEAFAFDLDPTSTTFAYMRDKDQIKHWLEHHPVSHQSLLMSWGDFWEQVKSGAAKVTNAIVYAAKMIDETAKDVVKTVVTAVVNGIERTMDFIIDTIEHAISLVHAIFNEIADSIGKVIEALSLLFDWQAIVRLKNDIKAKVEQAFNRLLRPQTPGGKSLLTKAREQGDQAFADLRHKLDDALAKLGDRVGKESASGVQRQAAGKNNPASGGARANWLQAKMQDNLLSEKAIETHALAAAPGGAIDIPVFALPSDLQDEISRFVGELKGKVVGDVKTSIENLERAIGDSGADLFAQSMHFFLELVRGAAHVGLDIVAGVFDTAIRLLEKILTAAWAYIHDSIIKIPFVSDLYRSVANSDLTALDLACLLIAVPASLAGAAASGARALVGAMPSSAVLAGIGQVVWSLVSVGVGVFNLEVAKVMSKLSSKDKNLVAAIRVALIAGFGLTARILFLWSDIETSGGNEDKLGTSIVLWLFPTLAIGVDLFAVYVGHKVPSEAVAIGAAVLVCVTGIGAAGFLAKFCADNKVVTPLAITFNALVAAALMARLAAVFEPEWVKLAAIAVVGSLVGLSGFVKIIDAAGGPESEQPAPAPVFRKAG